jgi:hypothetical protein
MNATYQPISRTHFHPLYCLRLPARLCADDTAALLGCQPHDIPVLIATKLLKPLGSPAQNAVKWFATSTLEEVRNDARWLNAATQAIYKHWHVQNVRRRNAMPDAAVV